MKKDNEYHLIITGKITNIIILGILLLAVLFDYTNVKFAYAFIEFCDDISFFLTFICISFCFVSFQIKQYDKSLFVLGTLNCIIANKLYSKQQLLNISTTIDRIENQKKFVIILSAIVVIGIIICIRKSIYNQKERKKGQENINNNHKSFEKKEENIARENENNVEGKKEENVGNSEHNRIIRIISTICFYIIVWTIIDYLFYQKLGDSLGLKRPSKSV